MSANDAKLNAKEFIEKLRAKQGKHEKPVAPGLKIAESDNDRLARQLITQKQRDEKFVDLEAERTKGENVEARQAYLRFHRDRVENRAHRRYHHRVSDGFPYEILDPKKFRNLVVLQMESPYFDPRWQTIARAQSGEFVFVIKIILQSFTFRSDFHFHNKN